MKSAGYDVRETDPFDTLAPFTLSTRAPSPYLTRTRLMWQKMRDQLIPIFQLFAPSVTAGIVRAADLAGYRNGPVFIRNSVHVPPAREAVRDMMPLLFELLYEETEPAVRVVLGHFIFVYIHPYFDGNGRMGRFLMNVMLAAGGYPWTVIPVECRSEYMAALEAASVESNIEPFAEFLGGLVRDNLEGHSGPKVPLA